MHHRVTRTPPLPGLDFAAIRTELRTPGAFPDDALDEARQTKQPMETTSRDATDIELVTIDPPGSMDLDQALAISTRSEGGWRVHYAIADVAAWVRPGGPVDREARRRTQTYYSPDLNEPLHPPALSTAAASLLPDGPRPAVLWTLDVDESGRLDSISLGRATVRSRAQLTYQQVQTMADEHRLPEPLAELPALGRVLLDDARRRGAIELGLPEQEVVATDRGEWTLELRSELDSERWNAQISLLTGRAAATLMIEGRLGLLRTLPRPDPEVVDRLRSVAAGLGIAWPETQTPGGLLASLDMATPHHAAFADLAAELLRGADYTAMEGTVPDDPGHGGIGAPYAHVTAPLRRLADRFTAETCLALFEGREVPDWAREALAGLPQIMSDGNRRARALERAVVDATEAWVLRDRVGHQFTAVVMESNHQGATVVVEDPAIRARCEGTGLVSGREITVRCTQADVERRLVRFQSVP